VAVTRNIVGLHSIGASQHCYYAGLQYDSVTAQRKVTNGLEWKTVGYRVNQ